MGICGNWFWFPLQNPATSGTWTCVALAKCSVFLQQLHQAAVASHFLPLARFNVDSRWKRCFSCILALSLFSRSQLFACLLIQTVSGSATLWAVPPYGQPSSSFWILPELAQFSFFRGKSDSRFQCSFMQGEFIFSIRWPLIISSAIFPTSYGTVRSLGSQSSNII